MVIQEIVPKEKDKTQQDGEGNAANHYAFISKLAAK
jgi:hypothetical protein